MQVLFFNMESFNFMFDYDKFQMDLYLHSRYTGIQVYRTWKVGWIYLLPAMEDLRIRSHVRHFLPERDT
jgi:hypothetical protein